eukprot:498426-Hanusia_phi.AAC.1
MRAVVRVGDECLERGSDVHEIVWHVRERVVRDAGVADAERELGGVKLGVHECALLRGADRVVPGEVLHQDQGEEFFGDRGEQVAYDDPCPALCVNAAHLHRGEHRLHVLEGLDDGVEVGEAGPHRVGGVHVHRGLHAVVCDDEPAVEELHVRHAGVRHRRLRSGILGLRSLASYLGCF